MCVCIIPEDSSEEKMGNICNQILLDVGVTTDELWVVNWIKCYYYYYIGHFYDCGKFICIEKSLCNKNGYIGVYLIKFYFVGFFCNLLHICAYWKIFSVCLVHQFNEAQR